jgi:hypothetical protein
MPTVKCICISDRTVTLTGSYDSSGIGPGFRIDGGTSPVENLWIRTRIITAARSNDAGIGSGDGQTSATSSVGVILIDMEP